VGRRVPPAPAEGRRPVKDTPPRLHRLTVTEAARLQGFPAEFRFEGSQSSQYAQIGNAVPPPLAEAVARALLGVLTGATPAAASTVRRWGLGASRDGILLDSGRPRRWDGAV
jgi:hypothetical protein